MSASPTPPAQRQPVHRDTRYCRCWMSAVKSRATTPFEAPRPLLQLPVARLTAPASANALRHPTATARRSIIRILAIDHETMRRGNTMLLGWTRAGRDWRRPCRLLSRQSQRTQPTTPPSSALRTCSQLHFTSGFITRPGCSYSWQPPTSGPSLQPANHLSPRNTTARELRS